MPRLHFEGLGNARSKERVLNRLLTYIAAATAAETCKFEQEEDMVVGDDYQILPPPPPPPPPLPGKAKEAKGTFVKFPD